MSSHRRATIFRCPICGLHYATRPLADQCEAYCSTHAACSLEITAHSMERQAVDKGRHHNAQPASRSHRLIEDVATNAEWTEVEARLQGLSFREVKRLAERLEIEFATDETATKDDYINILDEAYWDDLEREYQRVLGERR